MYHIDPYDKSIVIDGFQHGIADSPFDGISDMRNVNIISVPGEASVNFTLQKISTSPSGTVLSADAGADTVTVTNTAGFLQNKATVTFTGGSLPAGISSGTTYMIGNVSGSTFQIFISYATYISNSPVNITSDGTGTYTGVVMGKPTQRFFDKSSGNYYFADSNGRIWATDSAAATPYYLLGVDATTTTNASGNGVIVYRGYLFSFRNALIDYMVIATGVWAYAWQTMNTAGGTNNPHYAHFGQDDVIYYCDAAYVGSFFQKPGATFDPSNTATYTWGQQALKLPSNDIAQCLAEIGVNLLVGGQLNAIYPWNRTATSFTYPILLAENFITRMVTVNTNTYILAGQRGRIYITNGSQASLFKKVPDHISGVTEPYFQWGDLASTRNQLYFGIQARNSADNTVISQYGGLWAIDLDTQVIRLTNKLSFATYTGIATALLPIVPTPSGNPPFPTYTQGVGIYVGWDSGTSTYGIDYSSAVPYSTNEATIDSDLIPIGTFDHPRDFTRVEYRLTKPMVSGESVTLRYRLDFSQSYTDIFTDTATASNLPFSASHEVNFKNAQWVQIQIVLNSTSSSPSYTRLKEMRITGMS